MHALSTLLAGALPHVSPQGHAIIHGLAVRHGYPGPAHLFAAAVGLRNRFQLARTLQREGLPSLEVLGAWIRVLDWVLDWETSGQAVSDTALRALRDPAQCYRTVLRVTGLSWTEVRLRGSTWVLLELSALCRAKVAADAIGGIGA
jgi:hypothetical protein